MNNNNNPAAGVIGPNANGMFSSSFMMTPGIPMQHTSMGTPWDHIPRIGFGGNVGWPTSMAGQLASSRMGKSNAGNM